MVITPHALVGAALGRGRGALAGLALGAASHYALDQVPHRDYDLEGKSRALVPLEASAVAAVALKLGLKDRGSLAGALGGVLPDVVAVLSPRSRLSRLHARLHPDFRGVPAELSVAVQALTVVVALRCLSEEAR